MANSDGDTRSLEMVSVQTRGGVLDTLLRTSRGSCGTSPEVHYRGDVRCHSKRKATTNNHDGRKVINTLFKHLHSHSRNDRCLDPQLTWASSN